MSKRIREEVQELEEELQALGERIDGIRDLEENARRAGILKGARWDLASASTHLEDYESSLKDDATPTTAGDTAQSEVKGGDIA